MQETDAFDAGFMAVLTPDFLQLLEQTERVPLIRRELDPARFADEFEADQTWRLLTLLRRTTGYDSPRLSWETGPVYWHTEPRSMRASLFEIDRLASNGSQLDCMIKERQGKDFFTQQLIEEIVTCLRYDGFITDYESVRAVINGDRIPYTTAEKLAKRFQQIIIDLDRYAAEPFAPATLVALYSALTEGIEEEPFDVEPSSPLTSYYNVGATDFQSSHPTDELLQFICDIANGLADGGYRHPLITSMLVHCRFWHNTPFERYNNLVGYITSRYYLVRQGYSVLRYIPKIQLVEEWRQGHPLVELPYTFDEARVVEGDSLDWTAYYDCVLKLMLQGIRNLSKTFTRAQSADAKAFAVIDGMRRLNARQKDTLRRAVLVPSETLCLAYYQQEYSISYSSARNDLNALVDLGFFSQTNVGKTLAYRPVHNLKAVLLDSIG
jgi:Fic family protein